MEKLNIDQFKEITMSTIIVDAKAGGHVERGLRECVALSIMEWKPVKFTHNGRVFEIDPYELFKTIKGIKQLED